MKLIKSGSIRTVEKKNWQLADHSQWTFRSVPDQNVPPVPLPWVWRKSSSLTHNRKALTEMLTNDTDCFELNWNIWVYDPHFQRKGNDKWEVFTKCVSKGKIVSISAHHDMCSRSCSLRHALRLLLLFVLHFHVIKQSQVSHNGCASRYLAVACIHRVFDWRSPCLLTTTRHTA
jgi:hypothetical protein